jgi:hypothetical protein
MRIVRVVKGQAPCSDRCDVPVCAEHILRIPSRLDLRKPLHSLAECCFDAFGPLDLRQEVDVVTPRRRLTSPNRFKSNQMRR